MKPYLLALDQGTTSSRAILFDDKQNIVAINALEYPQIYPQPGWVEHDPKEILSSQTAVLTQVLQDAKVDPHHIAAIGITNQRETVIIWDKETGEPIYNAIVWQCRRTSKMVEKLYEDGHDSLIRSATGLLPDAYFSATKIRWILDHVPGAQERAERGELCAGTVDTWLVWNFTRGKSFITDYTNASRTMLYNIHNLEWDPRLLELFNIPLALLPEVVPSSYRFGEFEIEGTPIPIGGVVGDQQASLFGQACFHAGDTKNTYGTGCFLLRNTGSTPVESKNGLLTTIAYGVEGKVAYALEGSVFNAGSITQWLRDEMKMIDRAFEMGQVSAATPDTGGMYLVPAFTGLGAPHWNMRARGTAVGMTRATTREHFIRAAEEAIAYQVYDVVKALEADAGSPVTSLKVDGGASRDNFLLQFQSDLLEADILRGKIPESTALGATFLAGLAVGYFDSVESIEKTWQMQHTFHCEMESEERERLLKGWHRAIGRSLDWEQA